MQWTRFLRSFFQTQGHLTPTAVKVNSLVPPIVTIKNILPSNIFKVLEIEWKKIIDTLKSEKAHPYQLIEVLDFSKCVNLPSDSLLHSSSAGNFSPATPPRTFFDSSSANPSTPYVSPSRSRPPSAPVLFSVFSNCLNLKALHIGKAVNHLSDSEIKAFVSVILRGSYKLKLLDFSYCSVLTNESLALAASAGSVTKDIEVLLLRNCVRLTDSAVCQVVNYCTSLRRVDFRGCLFLGPTTALHLSRSNNGSPITLTDLDLGGCIRMTDNALVLSIYKVRFCIFGDW